MYFGGTICISIFFSLQAFKWAIPENIHTLPGSMNILPSEIPFEMLFHPCPLNSKVVNLPPPPLFSSLLDFQFLLQPSEIPCLIPYDFQTNEILCFHIFLEFFANNFQTKICLQVNQLITCIHGKMFSDQNFFFSHKF